MNGRPNESVGHKRREEREKNDTLTTMGRTSVMHCRVRSYLNEGNVERIGVRRALVLHQPSRHDISVPHNAPRHRRRAPGAFLTRRPDGPPCIVQHEKRRGRFYPTIVIQPFQPMISWSPRSPLGALYFFLCCAIFTIPIPLFS